MDVNKRKEILEDIKRHLDYVEATKQCSIRDNEIKVMYDYIINLQEENNKQKEVLDKIKEKVDQYELIKGYYDYIEENGYAETTSHDTLKEDILELLEDIK